ncbi:MAG: ATP-dependent helicase HrpB [Lentisphaeria bacterium]|nr:ATP-dependent helicase HrpB [Lentisphaeria bacterium]
MISYFDPAATQLPVAQIIEKLKTALSRRGRAVLCAPPGGGKSTLVPPSLLGADFLHGKRIIMLEPRRLAARNTAGRIAALLGTPLGEVVGCHTRFDHIGSKDVPIDVVTEGVFLRMLQNDPELTGVGLVIFDEFHERSIDADLGLAFALETASVLRNDLHILVMSATLDAEKVAALLKEDDSDEDVEIIVSEGRMYDVETFCNPPDPEKDLKENICNTVIKALNQYEGDVLVFLPGEGEIRQCMLFMEKRFPENGKDSLYFYPLYSNLSVEEQDMALRPSSPGKRKVIFATNVAETSLTVEGVRIVIDSGLVRKAVYSPGNGMNELITARISRSSADQRRGRAGRTAPGVCIRLWHISEERGMHAFDLPALLQADLASFVLQTARWGITASDIKNMKLLDLPPKGTLETAFELLCKLGALDKESGRITSYGKALSNYSLHPRLAHMVLAGEKMGKKTLACAIAALIQEKDILITKECADIAVRLQVLAEERKQNGEYTIDHNGLFRVKNILKKEFHIQEKELKKEDIYSDFPGRLLAYAYPDRIGKKQEKGKNEYLLANGKYCKLFEEDLLNKEEYLCVASAEGLSAVPRIRLAAVLNVAYIPENLKETVYETFWNSTNKSIDAYECIKTSSLALSRKKIPANSEKIPMNQRIETLFKGLRLHGAGVLPWSERELSIMKRSSFLHKYIGEEFPLLSPENLLDTMEEWLAPFLTSSCNSVSALSGNILAVAFDSLFDYNLKSELDRLAPERICVPTSSKIKVDYDSDPPHLAVRLQELFGLMDTPGIAGGRVKIVMEILSPAMRPIQVTSDLANFWKSSYFLVRKEMRGRYPKHDWPEDPLSAVAHRGVRKPRPDQEK